MKGFLSTLLVCLVAYSATGAPKCDVGKQIIDKIDSKNLNGKWSSKYLMPKSFSKEGRCWEMDYALSADGIAQVKATYISSQSRKTVSLSGSLELTENRNLKANFTENPDFNALYYVLAWDEDKGYHILRGCIPLLNYNPLIWVAFRQFPPSADSLEASKAALKKTGLKLEDFDENCE